MKRSKKLLILFILSVLLFPVWMFVAWLLWPTEKLVIAIIDKTVPLLKRDEHSSLTWILNNQKINKTTKSAYKSEYDYFGFFPSEKKNFEIKGLERFNAGSLERLSSDCDMIYYSDTYGISKKEWYQKDSVGLLYGGLSNNDLVFLRRAKEKKKLIVAEFNSIGSPTSKQNRNEFEKLFHLKWSGWIGRAIESLDTVVNAELPAWLIRNYQSEHKGKWPFNKAGVILLHHTGKVIILEEGTTLKSAIPIIQTNKEFASEHNLPDKIGYTYWFEVMNPDSSRNEVNASFDIQVNDAGLSELKQNGLKPIFPAIISNRKDDYSFYYFCADFCDNPITISSSYFKGVSLFSNYFVSKENPYDRSEFFWHYYRPLMEQMLNKKLGSK